MHKSIVYISGPIRGVDGYEYEFKKAEMRLQHPEIIVLNPAKILKGTEDRDCLPVCLQLVELADAVMLLPGWRQSLGACTEALYALRQNKMVFDSEGHPVDWENGGFVHG